MVSTVAVNECIFCVNEQQKVYIPWVEYLFTCQVTDVIGQLLDIWLEKVSLYC